MFLANFSISYLRCCLPQRSIRLLFLWVLAFPLPLFAQPAPTTPSFSPHNCQELKTLSREEAYRATSKTIQACIDQGFDLPKWIVPASSQKRGTSASASNSTINPIVPSPSNAPNKITEVPTAKRTAVDRYGTYAQQAAKVSLSFFEPLSNTASDPSKDIAGDDSTSNPNNNAAGTGTGETCPLNDLPTPAGADAPMGKNVTLPLNAPVQICGALIPLSPFIMNLTRNSNYMAITEYNLRKIWVYQRQGNSFKLIQYGVLPSALKHSKRVNWFKRKCVTTVQLTPPYPQITTFRATSGKVTIQLLPPVPKDATSQKNPVIESGKTRYFDLPIRMENGQLRLLIPPEDGCSTSPQYDQLYRETGVAMSDITIETPMQKTCTSSKKVCEKAEIADAMYIPSTCEITNISPNASTPNTEATCAATNQMLLLEKPNLLIAPGNPINTTAIEGRTPKMVRIHTGDLVFLGSGVKVRLNRPSNEYVFPLGGFLELTNDTRLQMNGPATLNMNDKKVILTGGGSLQNEFGNTLEIYDRDYTAQNLAIRQALSGESSTPANSVVRAGFLTMNNSVLSLTPAPGSSTLMDIEPGSLKLEGDQTLVIHQGARLQIADTQDIDSETVDTSTSLITLHGGGYIKDEEGNILLEYPSGTLFPPSEPSTPPVEVNLGNMSIDLIYETPESASAPPSGTSVPLNESYPFTIQPEMQLQLPNGFEVPTQMEPIYREPSLLDTALKK